MATKRTRVRRSTSTGYVEVRADSPNPDADLPAEWSAVRLAAALVDLETMKVRAITADALRVLGRPSAQSVVGAHAVDLVEPTDRDEAGAALEALRSGDTDFYRAHRRTPGSTTTWMIWAWARAVDLGGRRFAFVTWLDPGLGDQGRNASLKDLLVELISVGIASPECVVRYASVEPDNPLGITAQDLVGVRLADERRGSHIRMIAGHAASRNEGMSFAFPVPIASKGGAVINLACVLTTLVGAPDRLFMLSLPSSPPRVSELERHLWRIGAEVEASGILLNFGSLPARSLRRHPAAAALTPRQWEILRRIVAGERVPTIAKELFLSQSTVRNHLSAIFDRFGVHSQAELLAALTTTDASSS